MLTKTLYHDFKSSDSILLVEQSTHSYTTTIRNYFYSGCKDGKWYRLTNGNATEQSIRPLFDKLSENSELREEDEQSVNWLTTYYLPTAKHVNHLTIVEGSDDK